MPDEVTARSERVLEGVTACSEVADRSTRASAAVRIHDRGAARAFFERDRPWAAWALCSLSPNDWPYSALWVDAATGAGLWIFDRPSIGGAVHTFGGGDGLDTLIRTVRMPRQAFVKAMPGARAALAARYRFEWFDPIVRMAVTPGSFCPPGDPAPTESLDARHGRELARLYAGWPESRFHVGRLWRDYWYEGIRMDGRLVAVAECGIRSADEGVAVVQGVYVDPAWRGRGLARAATAALTARLFRAGAHDVVLDVRAENEAARAAYERLGYRVHAHFLGGPGA